MRVAWAANELKRDDLAALGKLFDLTAPRLVRYAQTLTRTRPDALQAAMVRVAQNPAHLAGADHPWAYVLRMVRNEALKQMQRKRPMQVLSDLVDSWTEDGIEGEREESAARIRNALQRLPDEQAEVVVLKIWEGMTFAEIAVVVSESANTVASRYRYALEKLSRYLQPLDREMCHG